MKSRLALVLTRKTYWYPVVVSSGIVATSAILYNKFNWIDKNMNNLYQKIDRAETKVYLLGVRMNDLEEKAKQNNANK